MRLLWDYYWPVVAIALVIGVIAGMFAFGPLRMRIGGGPEGEQAAHRKARLIRRLSIPFGGVAVLILTALWHGPLGTADRFRAQVDSAVRFTLDDWEMNEVQGRLANRPLTRTVVLSGPADNFQRRELVAIIGAVPGVSDVRWTQGRRSTFKVPLLAEVELWGLVGFGLGLLLAWFIEMRRRARAEWSW
jgi:hypothetical protein